MTKNQLKKTVKQLIRQQLNATRVDAKIDSLCASGLIDLEAENRKYRLPQMIVCALAKQIIFDNSQTGDMPEINNIWLGI